MRKVMIFAAATGAGLLLTGCPDPVMRDRHYIPAPADNVPVMENVQDTPAAEAAPLKEQKAEKKAAFQYEPMMDAIPSGGVDSVSGKKQSSKNYTAKGGTYIVKRGDTPERIARKHKVSLYAFMKVNNLDEASARRLRIGQKLIIPGGKDAAVSQIRTKRGKKSATASVAPALENGKYSVKPGDTPERIARRFKVKVSALLAANNLDEASARRLQIGQKLVIPGKSATPETTPVVTAPQPVSDTTIPAVPAVEQNVPAVDQNTTTAPVAEQTVPQQQDSSVTQPAASDAPIVDAPETVQQAQMSGVDVTEDISVAEFAARHGVSEAELRKANVSISGDKLTKGSLIFVPKK